MAEKRALITGVAGQDGAYLARLLLEKGYEVVGTHRPTSSVNLWRLDELGITSDARLKPVQQDMTDLGGTIRLLDRVQPDEVYNFAAQSFVGVSFVEPITTAQTTALGALSLLEAIRIVNPKVRFYQAGSSEMLGKSGDLHQDETTPFYPRSPYGVSKLFAHWSAVNYREAFGIFAACGILFNHESPLRGAEFVTRKITDGFARIKLGQLDCLRLGNLDVKRDWGYAAEYVDGVWRMLQADTADTFVLATGRNRTIRDFCSIASRCAGIELEWSGKGVDEIARDARTGKPLVRVDASLFRPADIDAVRGNSEKARSVLGWRADTGVEALCAMMVEADLRRRSAAGSNG